VDREWLLNSLHERIAAYDDGDVGPVLAPEALNEADQLLDHLGTPEGTDFTVLRAVGLVHLVRSSLHPEQDEAVASPPLAMVFLTPVYLVAPDAVPDVIADEIRPNLSPPEAGRAGQAHDLGIALGLIAQATGHPAVFHDAIAALVEAALVSAEQTDPRRPSYLATLGAMLRTRYERLGGPAILTNAISALTESVGTSRPNDPELPGRMAELGFALRLDFERTGDAASLEKAIMAGRRALELSPAEDPNRADILSHLAASLITGAVSREEATLAEEAVEVGREATTLRERDDPQRPTRLSNFALALQARHHMTGNPDDGWEATGLFREAIRITDSRDPNLPLMLSNLGYSLLSEDRDDIDDTTLDEAVSVLEQAVEATPPEHINYARCRMGLATALHLRWTRDADLTALDRCIETACTAVDAVPEHHPLLRTWLANLASVRKERGFLQRRPDEVGEAIETYRHLLRLTPEDDPQRATLLLALADLLNLQFALTAEVSAADEAINATRAALYSDTLDEQPRATVRLNAGAKLIDLAMVTGCDELSLEAATILRELLRDSTLEPATQAMAWHNLSVVLRMRHDSTGTGLNEALEAARQAVACSEVANAERAQRLANLAALLGQTHDGLNEAERLGRQAVLECPPDHPERPAVLATFAQTLWQRYHRFGDSEQLDEAITLLREAVTVTTASLNHGVRLMSLASALRARYARSPDLTTLNEAIAVSREATEVLPGTHHQRTRLLVNRVALLLEHYRRTGHLVSLTEAVETGEGAIAATPEDHPSLGQRLSNLGSALSARYDRTGELADLEAALKVDRRAVNVTPAGHPQRGRMLANLSAVLTKHHLLTGDRESIESAVCAAREAVNDTPNGHPSKPIRLLNLATALVELSDRTGERSLVLEAVRVAEVAAASTTATPFNQLRAARVWGRLAGMTGQWETAAAAFKQGVQLLPLVAPRNLHRLDLEHQLVNVDRIASNAAASAVGAGDAAGALEMLEQGRGVLLSYALDSRSEVTDLRVTAPELAAEWETLGEELDTAPDWPDETPSEEAVPVADPDHRHGLAQRWQSLLSRIRATTGFERFLEPPTLEDLLPAAASGAVVTVNVSDLRCDALVLTTDRVQVVPLPDLHTEELHTRVNTFLEALDIVGTGDLAQSMGAQAALRRTLAWLWDVLAEPVLDELGHTATPTVGSPWPRMWWSPTGLLNFLPLHAAGRYQAQDGHAVLDRVVSSYAPTIRALLHARSRPVTSQQRLLSVAMSRTPGQAPLPETLAEAEALARRFGGERPLVDAAATHGNVSSALPSVNWVHFACHAHSDPASPSNSHLLLHDRPMSVAEVSRLRLESAELAYLSACSTARGSAELADEAIHIASAFQLAGYRHVVGALWPLDDTTASRVAQGFYSHLTNGTSPADALHVVIRGIRDEQPITPSQWAAYVHAGP